MNNKNEDLILKVENLKKYFPIRKGIFRRIDGYVKAIDDVSFDISSGETFGLVGESGCGKTTTAKSIIRVIDPTDGNVYFYHDGKAYDLSKMSFAELKKIRLHMQMIFQDPFSSLNPRMTIMEVIGEPLIVNNIAKNRKLEQRVGSLLEEVGLSGEYLRRYPHSFSGGQRQRIGVARALAVNPELVVADEPVSALDVSIQAQILNLLQDIQERYGLSYLVITHDLSVVEHICDRVAVMYVGKLVETGRTEDIFFNPKHPYTEALLSSLPPADPRQDFAQTTLEGEVPNPSDPPSGCYFHPRCPYAKQICKEETPALDVINDKRKHQVACHRQQELQLEGLEKETS